MRPCNYSTCIVSTFIVVLSSRALAAEQQVATTVQLPTFGVAIDAEGLLSVKMFAAPDPALLAARLKAAQAALPGDAFAHSKLRKVSLNRLETALRQRVEAGQPPDGMMRHVAGLQRLQFVFFYPESGDVVFSGPAEGWIADASGRAVGIRSGRPVLLLDDLLVSLRAYPPGSQDKPFVGCTIDPSQEGLARLQQFQKTIPHAVSQHQRSYVARAMAKGIQDSLGTANTRVFGISSKTHFAQVMIEADYRMKRIAIGLEPPPVRMTTFIDAVGVPRHLTLQRWWFTPDYDCVRATDDGLAMELIGQGVQLQGEDKSIGADGALSDVPPAASSRAAQRFTANFTAKYPEIADVHPVYAQLRNQIDLLIAAAFIRKHDFYQRAGWDARLLLDESALPTATLPEPLSVRCAVNVVWKGNRLLCPAGGGVSIQADRALEHVRPDSDGQLAQARNAEHLPPENWWWD